MRISTNCQVHVLTSYTHRQSMGQPNENVQFHKYTLWYCDTSEIEVWYLYYWDISDIRTWDTFNQTKNNIKNAGYFSTICKSLTFTSADLLISCKKKKLLMILILHTCKGMLLEHKRGTVYRCKYLACRTGDLQFTCCISARSSGVSRTRRGSPISTTNGLPTNRWQLSLQAIQRTGLDRLMWRVLFKF